MTTTEKDIDRLPMARSLTDEMMDVVDRLGSEADTVDPRVWDHLLVYAPKHEAVEPVAFLEEVKTKHAYSRNLLFEQREMRGITVTPLYTQPPTTQAAVSAALRKAAEVCADESSKCPDVMQKVALDGAWVRISNLPHDKTALREFAMRVVSETLDHEHVHLDAPVDMKAIVDRALGASAA